MASSSSVRTAVHESLPYIDPEPTPSELAHAQSLIDAELSSLPAPPVPVYTYTPSFPPLLAPSHAQLSASEPLAPGIDLSRYEAQSSTSTSTSDSPPAPADLSRAYTAQSYLSSRSAHLSLLDRYGKNAWLVGNWASESELSALERELAAARREVDLVNLGRRRAQEASQGEMASLAEAWKRGVGRVLETEVAAEEVRRKVLERRREGVSASAPAAEGGEAGLQ